MNAVFNAHDDWDTLAVGYALSSLEPGELERFVAHLDGCVRCQHSVADAEAVAASLGAATSVAEPDAGLRARILAAAEEARPSVPVEPARLPVNFAPRHRTSEINAVSGSAPVASLEQARSRRSLRSLSRRTGYLLSAAAAVVVLALGATSLTLLTQRNHQQSVAAARQNILSSITSGGAAEVVPLRSLDGSSQQATVVAHDATVSVLTDSIAPNDRASSIYVLWGLTDPKDRTPHAIGSFDVSQSGLHTIQVASDIHGDFANVNTFAISSEKGRVIPPGPSRIVAKSWA